MASQPVDRVRTRRPGDADDVLHVEVSLERALALANLVGLPGLETVQGQAILGRVDADGRNVQLTRRAEHADRDLAAIGDKNLFKHRLQARICSS